MGMKTFLLGMLALGFGAYFSTAHAQIIALNFEGRLGGGGNVTDRTGVVEADAADWNNLGGQSGTGVSGLIETDGAIGDSGTNLGSSVSVTYSSTDAYSTGEVNLGNIFNGYLDGNGHAGGLPDPEVGTISVTVTNVPFALYDVYAYIAPTNNSVASSAAIGTETLSYTTPNTSETSFSVNSDPTATAPAVNTLLFTNVTGSTFTYLQQGGRDSSSTGLSGIEIVEVVPEPTTMNLMGLAAGFCVLGWIVRRRHSLA
jgi:hypothetical protein